MFRRAFVLDGPAGPSLATVRLLAPRADTHVLPTPGLAPNGTRGDSEESPAGQAPLDARALATSLGLQPGDLVALGPLPQCPARARAELAVRLALHHGVHVLSSGARCPVPSRPLGHVAFVTGADASELEALAALLPRFADAAHVSGILTHDGEARHAALGATLRAARPGRLVSVLGLSAFPTSLAQEVDCAAVAANVDLVVVPSDAISDVEALVHGFFAADALQQAARPTLLLPRTGRAPALFADRLAASDTLLLSKAPALVAVERNGPLGRVQLDPDELLSWDGTSLQHDLGVVALPEAGWDDETWLALSADPTDRCRVRALTPRLPLVLVDADSPEEVLAPLQPFAADSHLVFVRLRWDTALETLRQRLVERAPWVGVPLLLDACAWLDDGGAIDLPSAVDPIRLRRLARRLREQGVVVRAVVGGAIEAPASGPGVEANEPTAERTLGNEVRFELDNRRAREALLEAIGQARRTLHWQCYIVEEGEVAERFAAALADAAGRGVRVRLLIDALYSRHDVFRARNPVIERLDAIPGVEVSAYRPLGGVPDLVALKQRNHRKLVIVDDAVAAVSGRNLGAPYLTGFEEVALTRTSSYREVPWLDCCAWVRGPVVEQIQRAFLASWLASGGAPFEPGTASSPSGSSACRLVLHDGLRDTATFDAQLDLIRRARRRLVAVNAFPFAVELQRALVAAARRGVRVQVLFGSARPRFGEDQPFPGGVLRELADQLIRARLDPLVRAGGEVGELVLAPLPGWEPELARVFPYVHAKILVRDDEEAAVGSANFDVTAAYWESEALLVVEDPEAVGTLVAALDPLLASSRRADAADPRWQEQAALRAHLHRNWPALVG